MSILLGNVTVPSPVISGTQFPLTVDYPYEERNSIKVATHQFASLNAKVAQRFLIGAGGREFVVSRRQLNPILEASLKTFWLAQNGPVDLFPFKAPKQDGTAPLTLVRFKGDVLTLNALRGAVKSVDGLVLCEAPNYSHSGGTPGTWTYAAPSHPITSTVEARNAGSTIATALLQQNHAFYTLLKIVPLQSGYPAIYLSDRDVTLDGQLWQARILKWGGIEQYMVGGPSSTNSGADQATFTLGNADRVMSALKNDVDLRFARVEFSIFHADSGTKIDWWAGQISDWECGVGDPEFTIVATDGFSELSAMYPPRSIERVCWKVFNGGAGQPCNWGGTLNGAYPSASGTACDKGYKTPNGCVAHNNDAQWGGVDEQPQGVLININDTPLTSVSVISDSIFGKPLPEIWCDITPFLADNAQGMPIQPPLIGYRDEKDFANGLAVIGAGPLTEFSTPGTSYASDFMDSIPFHGWSADSGKIQRNMGLRLVKGDDPATDNFALGESHDGQPSAYTSDQKCAGLAFVELRIKKQSVFVPSSPDQHSMLITIRRGLQGYTWSTVGSRLALNSLANPIWVAVNAILRTKGYFYANTATQESLFTTYDAVQAGAVCDISSAKLIGTGSETQFTFNGVISEQRPLRDWIENILACCVGYYWIQFGKVTFGIRDNASAVEAFNTSNILWNSLRIRPAQVEFNRFSANFGDVEFNFQKNTVAYWDEDFAKYLGGNPALPKIIKNEIDLPGVCTKSQAARIALTRTREETGGIGTKCVKYHSDISFQTTILALNVAPGMVCSMGDSDTMLDLPNYPASEDGTHPAKSNFVKFRVNRIKLNPDFSIEVTGRTVHDDMYDMVNGPKPVDVAAPNPPSTAVFAPDNIIYNLTSDGDGSVILSDLQIGTNAADVIRVTLEIYSVDGTQSGGTCEIHTAVAPGDTTITFAGIAPEIGYALIDQEIVFITAVAGFIATVERGQLGTTAASHGAVNTTIGTVNPDWPLDLIVGTGLNINPGNRASNSTPAGNSFVSEYVRGTGLVRLSAPLGTAPTVGGTFHAYPLIRKLVVTSQMIPVPVGFFSSGDTADWTVPVSLPCAAVAYAQVKATSSAGVDSPWFGTSFNPIMRTHGGQDYRFRFSQIPIGTTADAFEHVTAPQDQDFIGAYARVSNITGVVAQPISSPASASSISLATLSATGSVTLSGTPDPNSQVQVRIGPVVVGGRPRGKVIYAQTWVSNSTLTTLAAMAADLADWLNNDATFSQYCMASAAGAVISITDLTNNGGTVARTASSGSLTSYAVAGFTSALGIYTGRPYAFAYEDATDGYLSSLSPVSDLSGPTGSYGGIGVGNIPVSADSRVTHIRIYAFPDGLTSGDCYQVGRIANTSSDGSGFTSFTDTQAESGLTGLTAYPGPTQPAQADDLIVKMFRDGVEWFEMHVPANAGASNIVATDALRGLSKGALLTATVINNIASLDLEVVLR